MAVAQKRKAVMMGTVAALFAGVLCLLLALPAIVLNGSPIVAQEEKSGPAAGPAKPEGAPAAASQPDRPLASSRPNPFVPGVVRGPDGKPIDASRLTSYGQDFGALPLTERLPFPTHDQYAVRPPVAPPPGLGEAIREIEEFPPVRMSGVVQSPEGSFQAVLEVAEEDTKSTKIVKPGDVFGPWMVTEIWNDHIILKHRDSGNTHRVDLQTEKEAPRPRRTLRAQPGMGMPGAGGTGLMAPAGAMPMAPGAQPQAGGRRQPGARPAAPEGTRRRQPGRR